MGPPPTPSRGEQAHTRAVEQLDEALERERELVVRAEAAAGTSGEDHAAGKLERARHQIAAREAWLVWTERQV
jgi:hypothetical protein